MYITALFRNDRYELGDGTNEDRGDESGEMGNDLAVVDLGTDFIPIDIAAGYEHVCAMTEANAVKCWGQFIFFLSPCYHLRVSYSKLQEAAVTDSSALAVGGTTNSETLCPHWSFLRISFPK